MTQKFTTPCFIRKNTAELRKKLEELGYKQVENGVNEWHIPMSKLPYLETGYDDRVGNFFVGENGYWHTCAIDCGTNEGLFLALAALREDNDYMQWFVDKRGVFVQCKHRQIQEFVDIAAINGYDIGGDWLRKATVEEIIEHFNK